MQAAADAVLAGGYVEIEGALGIVVTHERPHRLFTADAEVPALVLCLVDALARHGPYTPCEPYSITILDRMCSVDL